MPMRFLGMRHGCFWHYISISLSSAMIVADKYNFNGIKAEHPNEVFGLYATPLLPYALKEDGWFACVKVII